MAKLTPRDREANPLIRKVAEAWQPGPFMAEAVLPAHETLLKECATMAPEPLYPRLYAESSSIPRDDVNSVFNELRLAGLVRLTDWQKGKGQGYVLTDIGEQALKNPVQLAQLRSSMTSPHHGESAPVVHEPSARKTPLELGEAARQSLYDPEPPQIMPLLLLVNMIAFAVSFYVAIKMGIPASEFISQGDGRVLHQVGALSPVDLLRGEWWRLVTCCFLHFGLLHLFMNMFCIYSLGLLESLWGPPRYLYLYLASGIGGSCVAMIYNPGSPTEIHVLAGASGAIWGLMTSAGVWVFLNRSHLPPERVAIWAPWFGTMLAISVVVSFLPGVSASAHFGGGLVGLLLAILMHIQKVASPLRRTAATILSLLLPIICIAILAEAMKRDPRWLRLADLERSRLRILVIERFKQEVRPTIDQADSAMDSVESLADKVTSQPPKERVKFPMMSQLRTDLAKTRELANAANEKLGDKPYPDEALELARVAGRDYMNAIIEMVDRYEQILDGGAGWQKKEHIEMWLSLNKARATWRHIRNQL